MGLANCLLVTGSQWKCKTSHGALPSPHCYLLGQLAGFVGTVEDLIIEYGEVESQSQSDGMGWLHLGFADLKSVLVSFLRIIHHSCFSITNSHLSQVTEVVSLHFQIEYFGLSITGFSDQKFI